jgi:thiamine-monophosphate kinase
VDERDFTAGLARFFGRGKGVRVGIGDDAAVVRNHGAESVLCCDPVVEGVHFTKSTAAHLVGRKAVNRNLSDLAAMGAVADWLLVSLVLPRGYAGRRRTQLLSGIRAAARAGGCRVVGGDVATHAGPLVVTVTAVGHATGRVLTRGGACAGDTLHVTGPLGGSLAGHHLRFRPALREGAWLAAQSPVHAAMDVSDGLLLDLATLLRASGGLGAEIEASALPVRAAAIGNGPCALRSAMVRTMCCCGARRRAATWRRAVRCRPARAAPSAASPSHRDCGCSPTVAGNASSP